MPRVSFSTIGCKLNTYETETLRNQFARAGYHVVEFGEDADVTVVNTCTVTERADADCRKIVRRARRASEKARIVVTGCMAERIAEQVVDAPDVALVVGNRGKPALLRFVGDLLGGRLDTRVILDEVGEPSPSFLAVAPISRSDAESPGRRTRATLQVQDGCGEHCTYCIIPSVRGVSRSRPLGDIVAQTRTLVEAGYREIALTGVNTGSWGEDLDRRGRLVDVARAILDVPGVRRLRLNSIEPTAVTEELVDFAARTPQVCRHFHIPLQSGSDRVLRRMNRRYTAAQYRRIVERLAERVPDCAIGADVMVGFPGEEDAHFAETYRLIESLPLTYLHVFSYSEREGTPAMNLPGHLSRKVKDRRNRDLRRLGFEKRLAFHLRHVGRTLGVLVEDSREPETGRLRGLTDNYIRVTTDAPHSLVNTIVPVEITDASPDGAEGMVVEAHEEPQAA